MTEFMERVVILDNQGRAVFMCYPKYALLDIGGKRNEGDRSGFVETRIAAEPHASGVR